MSARRLDGRRSPRPRVRARHEPSVRAVACVASRVAGLAAVVLASQGCASSPGSTALAAPSTPARGAEGSTAGAGPSGAARVVLEVPLEPAHRWLRREPKPLQVAPATFDVAALPLGKLLTPPPHQAKKEASDVPATELVIEDTPPGWSSPGYRSVFVSVKNASLGSVRAGWSEGRFGPGQRGASVTCTKLGQTHNRYVPLSWTSFEKRPGGGLALVSAVGVFDVIECEGFVRERTTITLTPLPHGVFFAFREACDDCGGGQRVVLVGPPLVGAQASAQGGDANTSSLGSHSVTRLTLRKGGSAAVQARVLAGTIDTWRTQVSPTVPPLTGELLVGVDLVQGVSDPTPEAVVYATPRDGGEQRPDIVLQFQPPPPVPDKASPAPPPVRRVQPSQGLSSRL